MSVTLTSLIESVNSELENRIITGSAEVTGDGKSGVFLISPTGRTIVDDEYFAVFINDVVTDQYTMNFYSGECTMTSIPATTDTVSWNFDYIFWPESTVITAINAGINSLFPHFYVPVVSSTTTDGTSSEYAVQAGPDNSSKTITSSSVATETVITCVGHGFITGTTVTISGHTGSTPSISGDYVVTSTGDDTFTIPLSVSVAGTGGTASRPSTVEFVRAIDQRVSTSEPWKRMRSVRYEIYHDEGTTYIRFYTPPSSGFIRTHCICRPTQMLLAADTLESTAGLPRRAATPIASYACYYLLSQKLAPRVRSDVAVVTQGQGAIYPNQMKLASDAFMMRYQFELSATKMPPWMTR